jgi:hypothetical protein
MYLLVDIDAGGYIRSKKDRYKIVHRETRNIPRNTEWGEIFYRLDEAKTQLMGTSEAILELTEEGGGKTIWMPRESEKLLKDRLKIWKGCYGAWETLLLNPNNSPN